MSITLFEREFMERTDAPIDRLKTMRRVATAGLLVVYLAISASSQSGKDPREGDTPEAEFHMARIMYATSARAGSRGILQPMWGVDYPLAEAHFLPALRRYTQIDVAEDTRHLALTDDRLFQYPFIWIQQPGYWNPSEADVKRLREYLLRGGFLMLDDFHGEGEWDNFEYNIRRVLPEYQIVDIPQDDAVMQIFFTIDQRTQIPGDRHLRWGFGGAGVQMEGPPHWRGIYDDSHRLIVVANHNMDIGDAWEHADDPDYPLPMTAFAYQLGVDYVIYAMTH
jgi:hypothetical protein